MATKTDSWAFQDTSTECAICLEPLDHADYTYHTVGDATINGNPTTTIRLTCGHRWHLQCLREQLEMARPTYTKRLLFSGCRCAKCGTVCEHPALEDYTRTTDRLQQKVNELLVEQLNNDVASLPSSSKNILSNGSGNGNDNDTDTNQSLLLAWKKVQTSEDDPNNSDTKEQVLKEARKKYAFYMCSHCKEPYFGGTVECSDEMMVEEEDTAEPRLCLACTPQVVCRNPLEHLGSIVWKCRYCCQPATHVCYGNVHFCNHCHDRNTQRVHQLQIWKQEERVARRIGKKNSSTAPPPPLEPIPCSGKDCSFPKPSTSSNDTENDISPTVASATGASSSATAEFHSNGSSSECEQVYTCLICQSSSGEEEERLGSHNLLMNQSGELGLQGWKQLNRRRSWQVEDSDWPVNAETTTNFVSSFEPCIMSQVVDLGRLVPRLVSNQSPIQTNDFAVQVSARYKARTDCPSVFRLEAIAMDRNQRPLQQLQTAVLEAPPDHWGKAELLFEHLSLQRVKYVAIVVTGKDQRFWAGTFGSKVAACSVRILWDPNDTNANRDGNQNEAIMPRNMIRANPANRGIQQHGHLRNQQNNELRPPQEQQRNWVVFDLILPVLCFAVLAWLAA